MTRAATGPPAPLDDRPHHVSSSDRPTRKPQGPAFSEKAARLRTSTARPPSTATRARPTARDITRPRSSSRRAMLGRARRLPGGVSPIEPAGAADHAPRDRGDCSPTRSEGAISDQPDRQGSRSTPRRLPSPEFRFFDFEIRAAFTDAFGSASQFRHGLERRAASNVKWRSSISMSLR